MVTQEQRDIRDRLVSYDEQIIQAVDWVEMTSARLRAGSPKIVWTAKFELPKIGTIVSLQREKPILATVVNYGIVQVVDDFERAMWLRLGDEFVKVNSKEIVLVTEEEQKRIKKQDAEFKSRLIVAGKKVVSQRKKRRHKIVKGSHLVDEMLTLVTEAGLLNDEKSSFYKITGSVKGKIVYVAIKGGRVDLSGFNFEHEAVILITEEEARKRHLGKVRGTFDFSVSDEVAMDAYRQALSFLTS